MGINLTGSNVSRTYSRALVFQGIVAFAIAGVLHGFKQHTPSRTTYRHRNVFALKVSDTVQVRINWYYDRITASF